MGMLDLIETFVKRHELRDVAGELKSELKKEKYIQRIDDEIIKLCDVSIKHANERRENIAEMEKLKGVHVGGISFEAVGKLYTEVKRVLQRFSELKEEEHDNQCTARRMDQLVKKDYEIFQKFCIKLGQKAPKVIAQLNEGLGDYPDRSRLKETVTKLYQEGKWLVYEEGEETKIDNEVRTKIISLRAMSGREARLAEQMSERFERAGESVKASIQGLLHERSNINKVEEAVRALKMMFVELPKGQLDDLIEQQTKALNGIKQRELEKKEVLEKIEAILTKEELLLIELEKGKLTYDSSITMVFPLVEVTSGQMHDFLANERINIKKKQAIQMAEMYRTKGLEINHSKIKEILDSKEVKGSREKEARDRLRLIIRTLNMGPTNQTGSLYAQVIERENLLCSRTGAFERHVMRAMAREFLTQNLSDSDELTSLNLLNLLGYAFFIQLNQEVIEKTYNQIPRLHHKRGVIDYITIADSLIGKWFDMNLFSINVKDYLKVK